MKYIIQFRFKCLSTGEWSEWFRSKNQDTKGEFSDFTTARSAAEKEQMKTNSASNSYTTEYTVVPTKEAIIESKLHTAQAKLGSIKKILAEPTKGDRIRAILEESEL
jgi:hypothetical protein